MHRTPIRREENNPARIDAASPSRHSFLMSMRARALVILLALLLALQWGGSTANCRLMAQAVSLGPDICLALPVSEHTPDHAPDPGAMQDHTCPFCHLQAALPVPAPEPLPVPRAVFHPQPVWLAAAAPGRLFSPFVRPPTRGPPERV